jgi:hypothetical protein
MADTCPVCRIEDKGVTTSRAGCFQQAWSCPRCGSFVLGESLTTGTTLDQILGNDLNKRATLSHWIRTRHESMSRASSSGQLSTIILDRKMVQSLITNPLPSIAEQKNKFILWVGDNSRPGESVPVNANLQQSVMGAMTPKGFLLVLGQLEKTGLLTPTVVGGPSDTALTYKGWEYYEELRRGTINSRTAFMAMQYNETQLNDIVENVFRTSVRQTGFDLTVLRDKPKAGLIDDRLRVEIRAARFLIADLTHENAGAYWEAGYAEGLGKPVIYTCERKKFEGSKTHFDTNHHLTVLWNSEKQEDTAKELKATIRATLPAEAKLTDD